MEDDSYERARIIAALGEILPTSPDVITAIVKALGNEKGDPSAFYAALESLETLKSEPEARAAAPALLPVLKHDNVKIRFLAAAILWRIDNDAAVRAGVRDRGMRIVDEAQTR
jgi:HEAT repeat protein